MKYRVLLLAVRDMEASKAFYQDVLGMKITCDLGANVTLDGVLALQTLDTWRQLIERDNVTLENNAAELYFEEWDMDALMSRLAGYEIHYVHGLKEQPWAQRAVRFYDPDGHIIEVGEAMPAVVRRLLGQGMTLENAADRLGIPLEAVREMADIPAGGKLAP